MFGGPVTSYLTSFDSSLTGLCCPGVLFSCNQLFSSRFSTSDSRRRVVSCVLLLPVCCDGARDVTKGWRPLVCASDRLLLLPLRGELRGEPPSFARPARPFCLRSEPAAAAAAAIEDWFSLLHALFGPSTDSV